MSKRNMDSEEKENKNCKSAFTQKRSKLLVFRRDEKIPEDLTLLSYAEKEVSCVASIVSEAREKLRVKVQNLGGNAVLNFSIERIAGQGHTIGYEAKGIPALIFPASKEAKENQKKAFLERLYDENLVKRPIDATSEEKELTMPYSVAGIGICATLLFVLWCVFST